MADFGIASVKIGEYVKMFCDLLDLLISQTHKSYFI